MPLDSTTFLRPAISRSGIEIGNLRVLSEALKREMPEGWVWDYTKVAKPCECGTAGCAWGLGELLGLIPQTIDGWAAFGLSDAEGKDVFCRCTTYGQSLMKDVTPFMVAAKLDEIIARWERAVAAAKGEREA